jgi:hypothetical protein
VPRGPRTLVFLLALVAAVVTVVGAVSPWAEVRGHTFKGTDANAGTSVLIAAIVAILLLALATWLAQRWLSIVAAIPAAIAAAIAAYRLADIEHFVEGFNNASAKWGAWAATLGGVALVVLCVVHALIGGDADREATATPLAPQPPQASDRTTGL